MVLRFSLFLCQFEMRKLSINSRIFFANIDLPQELKCSLVRLSCLCGFMFEWLIIGTFFFLQSVYCLELYLSLLDHHYPPATMFEMAASLCSFFRLSAVAIIRLAIASGLSSSEISLVPTCSNSKDGSKSHLVRLI